MIADSNSIIRAYLITQSDLTDLLTNTDGSFRIFCPRLPENTDLPAVSFFTRGGVSNPHIAKIVDPSIQFDCWAGNPIDAREVYRALFSALQGIQMTDVVVSGTTYSIMSAIEEVQGQDLVDVEMPNYFRVLTFFNMMIRVET